MTNWHITPEPTEDERAAIEAALAEDEAEELPPPAWLEESSQLEP